MSKTLRKTAYRRQNHRRDITVEERRLLPVIVEMEPHWLAARAVYITGGSAACSHNPTDFSDHGDALCINCRGELWAAEMVNEDAVPNAVAWTTMRESALIHAAMTRQGQ